MMSNMEARSPGYYIYQRGGFARMRMRIKGRKGCLGGRSKVELDHKKGTNGEWMERQKGVDSKEVCWR